MKFSELQQILGNEVVFRSSALLAGQGSSGAVRRQIARWVASGKIIPLRRGIYVLAPPYAKRNPHPFVLANEMRRSSYVSLQSALAFYGMIPEFVPTTTSITTCRPEDLKTSLGRFVFRHVKQNLFFGLNAVEIVPSQFARIACPEKALLDLFYLTPGSDTESYLEELRLEPGSGVNPDRLHAMADHFGSAKVERAIQNLERLWRKNAEGTDV